MKHIIPQYRQLAILKTEADMNPSPSTEDAYFGLRSCLMSSVSVSVHYLVLNSKSYHRMYLTCRELYNLRTEYDRASMIDYLNWVADIHEQDLINQFFVEIKHVRAPSSFDKAKFLYIEDSYLLALVDPEDYDAVAHYKINAKDGYARFSRTTLHRFVMEKHGEIVKDKVIDHRNHNPMDCRKSNLRLCSRLENNYNKPIQSNNKSGYKGVHKSPRGIYIAHIAANGGQKNIGYFTNPEDAALAYDIYAKKYHGQFAVLNRPDAPQKEIDRIINHIMYPLRNRSSSSQYYGVSWHEKSKKWIASFVYQRKRYYIGLFDDEIKAAEAVDEKLILLGARHRLNFNKSIDDVVNLNAKY